MFGGGEASSRPPLGSLRRVESRSRHSESGHINFWERNFPSAESTSWTAFASAFLREYDESIADYESLVSRKEWLLSLVHRHVFSMEASGKYKV